MHDASDLARRLSRNAEAVCRHYLPQGRRQGRYWLVGDVEGSPGRSLFVRLAGPESGKGAAGKWTDAATAEHGDLLDLIAANQRLISLADTLEEARRFLALPQPEPTPARRREPAPTGSPEAARRLFAISKPLPGTVGARYLRERGITVLPSSDTLRFHPRCFYRPKDDEAAERDAWPALIAAVRDSVGGLTGVSRTWLALDGADKAPIATPRRAMGQLLGNAIRFGSPAEVLAAGEGVETMLSLRQISPTLPVVAATSANHLAALELPDGLRRLYIARDDDPAGRMAADTLGAKAREGGIEVLLLDPTLGDLNDDLRLLGRATLAANMRMQLAPEDAARFLLPNAIDRKAV